MRYTSRNVTDRFILDSFTIYKAFSNEIVVAISQLKTPPYQLSPPGLERWTSYCVRFQTSIAVNAANFLYPIHIITVDWLSSIVLCLWEGSHQLSNSRNIDPKCFYLKQYQEACPQYIYNSMSTVPVCATWKLVLRSRPARYDAKIRLLTILALTKSNAVRIGLHNQLMHIKILLVFLLLVLPWS